MYEQQYLGMYIELEYDYEFVHESELVCENGHLFYSNKAGNFCPKDGTEIKSKPKRVERVITFYDLVDEELVPAEIDDFSVIDMDSSDKTWLVQNLTTGKYGIFLDEADYGAYSLSTNSDKVIADFKEEFEELIAKLQKYCKSVKIDYGLVKFYS